MKTIIVDFLPAYDEIMLKTDQVFFFSFVFFYFFLIPLVAIENWLNTEETCN